jgi:hypothetical protein
MKQQPGAARRRATAIARLADFTARLDADHQAEVVVLSACRICGCGTVEPPRGGLRHDLAPDELRRAAVWLRRRANT